MEKEAKIELILAILDKALFYGIPVVKTALENLNKDVITSEDIKNLYIEDNSDNWFSENN